MRLVIFKSLFSNTWTRTVWKHTRRW